MLKPMNTLVACCLQLCKRRSEPAQASRAPVMVNVSGVERYSDHMNAWLSSSMIDSSTYFATDLLRAFVELREENSDCDMDWRRALDGGAGEDALVGDDDESGEDKTLVEELRARWWHE